MSPTTAVSVTVISVTAIAGLVKIASEAMDKGYNGDVKFKGMGDTKFSLRLSKN